MREGHKRGRARGTRLEVESRHARVGDLPRLLLLPGLGRGQYALGCCPRTSQSKARPSNKGKAGREIDEDSAEALKMTTFRNDMQIIR